MLTSSIDSRSTIPLSELDEPVDLNVEAHQGPFQGTDIARLAVIKKLTGAEVVRGMAHITGGGITENLPRILPKGLGAVVDLGSWQPPPIFEHLQVLGNVAQDEMLRTFNMGIGLICVVPAEKVKKAKAILNRANERHCIIGRVTRGERKVTYN